MKDICSRCPNYHSDICSAYPKCGFFNYLSDIYFKDLINDFKEKNLLGQQNIKAFIHLCKRKLANGVELEHYLLDDLSAGLIVDAIFNDGTSLTLDLTDDNVYNNSSIIRETIVYKVDEILKEEYMCEYFLSCANYKNDCNCDSCKSYTILEKHTKDKFKEFLKELKATNLLEYRPIQAAIILTKEKLDNGINITNFDIQIPRDNPIWYDINVFFDNQTTLNAYQDDFAEDKFQGICSITDYNIDDILMR